MEEETTNKREPWPTGLFACCSGSIFFFFFFLSFSLCFCVFIFLVALLKGEGVD